MIKPTIGRLVWFTPSNDSGRPRISGLPLAAIIVGILSDTCINLAVFDANGDSFGQTSVPLIQDDTTEKPDGFYAEWMPYQQKQAAIDEMAELEKAFMGGSITFKDERTDEEKQAANERQTAEMSAHIKKMLETIKPDLIEVFGDKTREKYIAAALTGLLANERLTKLDRDEIAELAIGYTDAVILATQETTNA